MWYWFLAAVVFVTAVFAWDYRRRAAKRESASRRRFEEMFKAGAPVAAPAPAAPLAPAPAPDAAPDPGPAVAYSAQDRLLNQAETLVYYLLKTGLPDHEVFAKVPLTAVVGIPGSGYDREQQARRLSRHQLDFVICDKRMRIVSAVQLAATGAEAAVAHRIQADCLRAAGIRLVKVDATSLPRRGDVRAAMLGEAERVGGTGATPTLKL